MPRKQPAPFYIIDRLIRSGQIGRAQRELRALSAAGRVPSGYAAEFGVLARRTGLGPLGIRALNAIVRPAARARRPATAAESAAYAACLIQIGATEEATELLDAIDPALCPDVWFHRYSALVSRWEYAEAIPYLQRYLREEAIDEYQRLVARANLADAFVFEGFHAKARPLLDELIKEAAGRELALVHRHLVTLSALNAIHAERWREAARFLDRAESSLDTRSGAEGLILAKYRAILLLFRDGPNDAVFTLLGRLKKQAAEIGHWETMRDCDRFVAIGTRNLDRLAHVWFGTPYSNFRAKLLAEFGGSPAIPGEYTWTPGADAASARVLDAATGAGLRGEPALRPGDTAHRLLLALCSDFYRPHRAAALHSRLYPGDYYNPLSSPARVRQAISRLRSLFRRHAIPLLVEEVAGAYRLKAAGRCGVRLPRTDASLTRIEWGMRAIREKWGTELFSPAQAVETLGKPPRTVRFLLEGALEAGIVAREGRGRSTRYRFRSKV